MSSENERRKKIAIIGLEKNEIPLLAKWQSPIKNMMTSLRIVLFSRSFPPCFSHFMVAMDFHYGIRVMEYLIDLQSNGEIWSDIEFEMISVFGMVNEKGMRRSKKKYYQIRQLVPEIRFVDQKRQHQYLLETCDEIIFMTLGENTYKNKLIEKADRMGKEITIIEPRETRHKGICILSPREMARMCERIIDAELKKIAPIDNIKQSGRRQTKKVQVLKKQYCFF